MNVTLERLGVDETRCLFVALQTAGMPVGLDDLRRAIDLLLTLKIRLAPDALVIELESYFSPVFCRDPLDQLHFHEIYVQWANEMHFASESFAADTLPSETSIAVDVPKDNKAFLIVWSLGVLAMIAGVAFLVMLGLKIDDMVTLPGGVETAPQFVTNNKSDMSYALPDSGSQPAEYVLELPGAESINQRRFLQIALLAGSVVPLALFLCWFIFSQRALKGWRTTHEQLINPLAAITDLENGDPFGLPAYREQANRYRTPESLTTRELDADRTIVATLREGLFQPFFRQRKVLAEMLVLVQRMHPEDHLAALMGEYEEHLNGEGITSHLFFFDSDPGWCFASTGGDVIRLRSLMASFGHCRLILVADCRALLDPVTMQVTETFLDLKSWTQSVVLVPGRYEEWTAAETTVEDQGLVVIPFNEVGLQTASEVLGGSASAVDLEAVRRAEITKLWHPGSESMSDRIMQAQSLSVHECGPFLSEVQHYIGDDAFKLLRLCAVFPDLSWELTRALAEHVQGGGKKTPAWQLSQLVTVARLPWFRTGTIPQNIRDALSQPMLDNEAVQLRRFVVDQIRTDLVGLSHYDERDDRWISNFFKSSPALSSFRDPLFARAVANVTFASSHSFLSRFLGLSGKSQPLKQLLRGLALTCAVGYAIAYLGEQWLPESENIAATEALNQRVSEGDIGRRVQEFYNQNGPFKGQFVMDYISRILVRADPKDPQRIIAQVQYHYLPVMQTRQASQRFEAGFDRREVRLTWDGQDYVVNGFSGHMSARMLDSQPSYEVTWMEVSSAVAAYLRRYNKEEDTDLVVGQVSAITLEAVDQDRFVAHVGYYTGAGRMSQYCVVRPFTLQMGEGGLQVQGMGLGWEGGISGNVRKDFVATLTQDAGGPAPRLISRVLPDSQISGRTWLYALVSNGCGGSSYLEFSAELHVPGKNHVQMRSLASPFQRVANCDNCREGVLVATLGTGKILELPVDLTVATPVLSKRAK